MPSKTGKKRDQQVMNVTDPNSSSMLVAPEQAKMKSKYKTIDKKS